MTKPQELHLERIKERGLALLDAKYRAGQREHGGNLWQKPMVRNIMEESLDLLVYTLTLEQQMEEMRGICSAGESGEISARVALGKVRRLL
jgi:phage terminase large subunit GpA-like protein